MRKIYILILLLFIFQISFSQFSLTVSTYSQDFNTLANSATSSTVPTGWAFNETGTNANTTYTAGTGSSNSGDTYSFGSSASTERAFGGLLSSNLNPTIGFYIINNTGNTISSLAISYTGEQWRLGAIGRVDQLDFQYSLNAIDLTTGSWTDANSLDFVAPVTTGTIGALDGNLSGNKVAISNNITGLNIANGATLFIRWNDFNATGSDDGLGIDDFSFTATFLSSNTITIGSVLAPPFILASCATPMVGTVGFSFTGSFNTGNIFTAQLSDDIGSFSSAVNIGTLPFAGTDPSGLTIPIVIPAGTPGGSGYLIRIISDNPSVTGSSSSPFTITQLGTGGCASSHSDYYRSFQTGNWGAALTWESSPDNANWITATLSPTSLANTISVRSTHIVTLSAAASADQLVIEAGGTLVNNMASSNVFTIDNGTGDDMVIKGTGVYQITSANGYLGYQTVSAGATVHIEALGIIRIGAGGALGGGSQNSFATITTTYIWDTGSIFDWNTTAFPGTTGAIYFPDATSFIVPVLRFSAAPGAAIGGASALQVNGVLEANTNLIFDATSNKTFRNGILGTGNVTMNAGVGRLIVDGTIVGFGGTGVIYPNSLGLLLGANSIVTTGGLISSKTISGDIYFNSSATSVNLDLSTYDLTVSGNIFNGNATRFIKTSATGSLTLKSIAPAATKIFPIGNLSYNPITITNNDGLSTTADFTARVETGINPPIAFPTYGINRTWNIHASSLITDAGIVFQYATADANPSAIPPQNMEILQYSGIAWSIITGQNNIVTGGADPAWTITTNGSGITINNSATPYAIGIEGTAILPIDCIISCRSRKANNNGIVYWEMNSCAEISSFEVQRSVGGRPFVTIGSIRPGTQLDYSYTDVNLDKGTNLYRIKVNRSSGAIKYSNTVAVINDSKGILITALAPNPVSNLSTLVINAAKPTTVHFMIYAISGLPVKQWQQRISEGSNTVTINAEGLPAGIYQLAATAGEEKTVTRFVKE